MFHHHRVVGLSMLLLLVLSWIGQTTAWFGSNANGYVASSSIAVQGDVSVLCPTKSGTSGSSVSVCTSLQQNTPVGSVIMFAGATAPPGYLLCDGSTVSRSTYAPLFAVLQTSYGVGDGSTTFTLPDLRSKTVVGAGQGSTSGRVLTSRSLGDQGGEEQHTMTTAEMPTHTHTLTDPSHTHGVLDPGHTHAWQGVLGNADSGGEGNHWRYNGATAATTASVTGIGVVSATTGITIAAAGQGQPHNNMQPFITLNYIIKY